ncbi:tumor necrosis factor receptor superfamily member 16 [Strongylocentrotus purpuratus]|uniref:Tumor necrosis factor receptor superfamily member 16 n=1 Tax=Strongylocentrotus purpuratus TaxID=7668 RepID=A0A7M7N2I5_STRPU|nr:tumor necrosis factor receptor superfamily member 16 [Strongylocentrotus purpuratus]
MPAETQEPSTSFTPTGIPMNSTVTETAECKTGVYSTTGECCEECPDGFGVHRQCSDPNATNTICTICETGMTYSSVTSHLMPCQTCTRCSHNEVMTSSCSIMQDTECDCAPNYFRTDPQSGVPATGTASMCSQCMFCPPGFGAAVPCSPRQSSRCELCENGTYSDIVSSTEGCKKCTVCREGSIVLKRCTDISDTVCSDTYIPAVTDRPENDGITTTAWIPRSNRTSSGFSVVPIFCTLLGLVIFGLLAYVIFKKWSFKKMKLRQTQKMTRSSSCHTDIEGNTISILSLKNGQSYASRDSALDRSGVGSICRQPLMAVPSAMPYQQLPSDKRYEVERSLSVARMDGRDWRGLARELGFSDLDIVHIAQTCTGSTPPARAMLISLHSRDIKRATVGTLVEALRRIRRNDVADLIPIFTYSAYHFPGS